jgi:uncharacterized protein
MSITINRRKFFSNTAMSAAGLMLGANLPGFGMENQADSSQSDLMKEVKKYRKIDAHVHAYLAPNVGPEVLLDYADRMGITKLFISRPITNDGAPFQEFRDSNDMMIKVMKQYPDRFKAEFTLNPGYAKESLEEIERCVDQGMVGLKLYHQYKISDPLFYPILEKMIDHKMITLMHSCLVLGRGSYRTKYGNLYPNESTPEDFVVAAKRYPEAMLQVAHTGGGGDWEAACKAIKDYPNIYIDVSGSNNEGDMMNYALKYVGEDRLFYGSDNSYYQVVSNILSSELTEVQRKKIFFDNYNNMLKKGGYNVA